MLDAGLFAGTHLAMMVHPSNVDRVHAHVLAGGDLRIDFSGKNAHASAEPYEGINAGDAITLTQVAIGLLRQQLRPGDQIHGIVTNGGEAPNIISRASQRYLLPARIRARRCTFSSSGSGAASEARVGDRLRTGRHPNRAELLRVPDKHGAFADFYGATPGASGASRRAGVGSVRIYDMANVSRAIPAIHPEIAIDCGSATAHQPEFRRPLRGNGRTVRSSTAPPRWRATIADVASDPTLRAQFIAGN